MTIQQLHYAVTIAEAGTYSRAAELLYIAQPSLTNAIKELEKELGILIFNRSGRGVTLTPVGEEFIAQARQVCSEYDSLRDRYTGGIAVKRKFGVSAQHYSFATKAFMDLIRHYGADEYEFAIRETQTREVIEQVARQKSEIGILYLCDMNRTILTRIFRLKGLEFHKLTECRAYVYLWRGHPLASESAVSLDQLKGYPCLMFEQGEGESYYYAEEILSDLDYPQIIRATDRAAMLNLMVGLNGYTLCSGIISDELNGGDYVTVPYQDNGGNPNTVMEIGYICREGAALSEIGQRYIEEVQKYLVQHGE